MRSIAFFLCLAASIALCGAAIAYETPTPDPKSREMIESAANTEAIKDIVADFGTSKLVWGNVGSGGQVIQLQFMPEDLTDPRMWTRMLEVSVYGLSGDQKADLEAMKKIIYGLENAARLILKEDPARDHNYMMNEGKDIGLYLQYTLNPGTPEHVTRVASFLRISDKSAAYFQLNARGVPMKKSEARKMHFLVNPMADEEEDTGRKKKKKQ